MACLILSLNYPRKKDRLEGICLTEEGMCLTAVKSDASNEVGHATADSAKGEASKEVSPTAEGVGLTL